MAQLDFDDALGLPLSHLFLAGAWVCGLQLCQECGGVKSAEMEDVK